MDRCNCIFQREYRRPWFPPENRYHLLADTQHRIVHHLSDSVARWWWQPYVDLGGIDLEPQEQAPMLKQSAKKEQHRNNHTDMRQQIAILLFSRCGRKTHKTEHDFLKDVHEKNIYIYLPFFLQIFFFVGKLLVHRYGIYCIAFTRRTEKKIWVFTALSSNVRLAESNKRHWMV